MKSCDTCKHCEPTAGYEGECRHDTPRMDGAFTARWPTVEDITEKWCSEWDATMPVEISARRPSGKKADPLAHFGKRASLCIECGKPMEPGRMLCWGCWDERFSELVRLGVDADDAAHQVDVEFGFDGRTAMADSRDSAESPAVQ